MKRHKSTSLDSGKAAVTVPPPAPPAPAPIEIKSLAQLQAMCEKRLRVEFTLDGQPCLLEVRRLTPSEDAALDNILNGVTPPVLKGKTVDDDRPDFANPDYLKRKQEAELQARAMALYWCVPIFKAERPDLQTASEIVPFVQSKLNAQILNILWQAVRSGGVSKAELVNFTSANA